MMHREGIRARLECVSWLAAVAALIGVAACAGPDMEQVRMAETEAALAMDEADYSGAIEALTRARAILPEDTGLLFELPWFRRNTADMRSLGRAILEAVLDTDLGDG